VACLHVEINQVVGGSYLDIEDFFFISDQIQGPFICRFSLLTEMRVGTAALPEKGSETFNSPLNAYQFFDKNE
jgi:hypothetical protein